MNFVTFSDELLRHRPRRSAGLAIVERVGSTRQLARRIVGEYLDDGDAVPDTEVVAWRQLAGQGRRGRAWSSPPGAGVYATMIRSRSDAAWLQTLPLRAAVALCETVNRHLDGRCRVKWPNDLLVGRDKLGGLLVDAVSRGHETVAALVSFGINHRPDLAALGVPRATSLGHELEPPATLPSLAVFAGELLDALDGELTRADRPADVVRRYRELSAHAPGDTLRCRLDGDLLEGCFLGFDDHGFLRLEIGGEERRLSAGEVLCDD